MTGVFLIAPVKVKGAGIYCGDVHAMQGPGEIAGHTCDVCASVTLRVSVIKGLGIDGPILIPNPEDVPYLARPLSTEEKLAARYEAAKWGMGSFEEDSAPLDFIGTGTLMNDAINNGLERAAAFLGMSIPEVMNRVTITGSIDIGRAPGVVTVSLRVPKAILVEKQLWEIVREQYHLD